jgi:uncharacterized membrane protein SirB2
MKHIFKIFEWETSFDFVHSLFPSIKLNITIPLLFTGGFLSLVTEMMGVKVQTLVAICIALLAELVSGIYASIKRGERIRSAKFGRFVVKAFVWLASIFIVNAFCKEFAEDKTAMASGLMTWVRSAFLLTCFMEYMISINENMESIFGGKSIFIRILKEKITNLITGSKSLPDDNENNTPMKTVLILVLASACLVSCKTAQQTTQMPQRKEHFTTITETVHDTVLIVKADTVRLTAKLVTDSAGKITIVNKKVTSTTQARAKAPWVEIKDDDLFVECFCDTAAILFNYKETTKMDSTVNTIVLPPTFIEKKFTRWQKFQIWAGRLLLSLLSIYLILFVLKRLKYI